MSADRRTPARARRSTPARSLPTVVARFVRTETPGGIAPVVAAVVALGWANSPWQDSYETLWHSEVILGFGVFRVEEDLAFTDPQLADAAKVAILAASVASSVLGASLLLIRGPSAAAATTADAGPTRESG